MKRFNLEEYLKNPSLKVVTRDGRSVKIHCTNHTPFWPVLAKIEGSDSSMSYQSDGRYFFNDDSTYDLFFAPEKHERWINLYKDDDFVYVSMDTFNTKKEAEAASCSTCVATVKIEWEE